jgi:hypothetical protein
MVPNEPEHQRIVGDLDGRRVSAQDRVDGGADTPAGRELQDRLAGHVRRRDAGPLAERVTHRADEHQRFTDQRGQDDTARRAARSGVGRAGGQRDVHGAVPDRLQVSR